MTETHIADALDRGADRARYHPGHRLMWIAVGVLIVCLALQGVAYYSGRAASSARDVEQDRTIGHLADQTAAYERAAKLLADQVQQLGAVPAVQLPNTPPTPPATPRGIERTAVEGGRLLITYTGGITEDKGRIAGQDGKPGDSPPGVAGAALSDGNLVITYTDGRTEVIGRVVGPTGRGIRDVDGTTGRLIITYDDGTTDDAGPLPAGPPGRGVHRSVVVDCRWRVTYTDGTTEDAGNACTTQTRTVTPAPTTTTAAPTPPLLPPS